MNATHVSAKGNISAVGNVHGDNINVTGDITLINGDCADEFDVDPVDAEPVVPGTVGRGWRWVGGLGEDGNLRRSARR